MKDIELMEHADGEAEVSLDEAGRAKVESIHAVGEAVRGQLELAADAVPDAKFAAMWRRIDEATAKVPERSFLGKVAGWFDHYRGYVITGALSAGAVAALALVLRGPSNDGGAVAGRTDAIDVRPVALRSPPEIESLDTPGGSSTVINLEDEDGHTTMIWVTPADTLEGI